MFQYVPWRPKSRNKYRLPHQGPRECARRIRQRLAREARHAGQ